jgi:hypothetical protein
MKRNSPALVFNIFLAVGILLFIITGISCYNIKKFEETAVKTSGRVIDLIEKRRSGSRSATYSPVVIYEDDRGMQHQYVPGFSSNPPAFDIGESIEMHYDPRKPGDAKIAGWHEYIGGLITGGLGLIFSLIGIGYHAARKFRKSGNAPLA